MNKNNKFLVLSYRIIRIIHAVALIGLVLVTFFLLAGIFNIVMNLDVVIHHSEYKKKEIVVDSMYYSTNFGYDLDGEAVFSAIGYSKELNNYNTKIDFGMTIMSTLSQYEKPLINEENDTIGYHYHIKVWYRDNGNKAFLAKAEESQFPIKKRLKKELKLLPYWVILLIVSRICTVITKKYHPEKRKNL